MYFPYFRGRQYELLALRELADNELIGSKVVPVIEPVKLMPTLNSSLKAFTTAELSVGLILNPNIGDLTDEADTIHELLQEYSENSSIIPSLLINETSKSLLAKLCEKTVSKEDLLVVFDNRDYLDIYMDIFDKKQPKFALCPDDRALRRKIQNNKILFENRFNKVLRNADYCEEEFYSDDHLYFKEEGYSGFGDYSIVGSEYVESGFAPYAVAIHIVYFAEDHSLRIKHFVSDTNEDISNVAGKFYEAVTKLHSWYEQGYENQLTSGLETLLNHYRHGTYPGLPTLKKLSIMHHLELMSKFLDGNLVI